MNSNSNIFGMDSSCIPQETLTKYLKGELSGAEMNAVERHLSGCPMCSDELEGLTLLENPDDIKRIAQSINQRIEESIVQRRKSFWYSTQFKVAASVLLLVAVSGAIYFTSTLESPTKTISELIIPDEEMIPEDSLEKEIVISEEIIPITRSEEIKPREERKVEPPQPDDIILDIVDSDDIIAEASTTRTGETIAETRNEQAMGAAAPPSLSRKKESTSKKLAKPLESITILEDNVELSEKLDLLDSSKDIDYSARIIAFNEEEAELEEAEIFVLVEDMPRFQGGDINKFQEHLAKNLRYPESAAEKGIQGKVFVSFIIEADGSVTNAKVVKGIDPLLDEEALRVVKTSPKWEPGKQRGKPVRVHFTFPVSFVLH